MPGDIVLYYSSDCDINHSGIVLASPEDDLDQPRVLSKWGAGPEYIHLATDFGYDFAEIKYMRIVDDESE